ncbi:MAG: hypothetical protein Q9181_007288 [Wetmoreana brouardii]
MPSPLVKATLQSTVLALCSALVATFFTPKSPPIVALVIFAFLATPPNFLWQQYLERKLPGYKTEKHESNGEVKDGTPAAGGVTVKRRLNVPNTLMKVMIDQTIGSVVNVALYLAGVSALQGVPLAECLQVVKEQTWPLMIAGYKLWPLVSLLSFTVVPVEQRTVVGSLVGLGWVLTPPIGRHQELVALVKCNLHHEPLVTLQGSWYPKVKMTSHRPFRPRPNLHLALTQQTGSPRNPNTPVPNSSSFSSPFGTPTTTPLAITSYSPSQSNKLKAPSAYGGPMHFTPRQKHKYRRYYRAVWLRLKWWLSIRATWFFIVVFLMLWWWLNGGSQELDAVKLGAAGFGRDLFQDGVTQDMQFFPPSNSKIHYVGRWTATPNQLRKDGTFPGVYFDITIKNTTSVFLSLRNAPEKNDVLATPSTDSSPAVPNNAHLSFRPESANAKPAPPVSLLARIDQEEYILLPNASFLVAICSSSLKRDAAHNIRIIAPMTDDQGKGVVQLEGIWLSKGGQFERIEGTLDSEDYSDEDLLSAQSDQVGEKHRTGLNQLLRGSGRSGRAEQQAVLKNSEGLQDFRDRRKLLEIVTDSPGSSSRRSQGKRTGGADGLLAGVMGWEYLLGEMFGVDHVAIGIDGMCLIQDCIGGVGQPAGIGDVFFRSGPPGSSYLEHPWLFSRSIPDVLVLNLGNSDRTSIDLHASEYNKTAWDLSERFENTYVSLVKAIRTLAYPKHPATVQSERSNYAIYVPNTIPADIPIFVMRPLRGELEHATQNIVNRLRADGDKAVFWLDTSGWLNPDASVDDPSKQVNEDFYLDDRSVPSKWRLTERGNQRTAIFLHMHVCRYLAREGEKCPFLPSEVYQGKVFDPAERDFERYVEGEKERKLKKLFWGEGAEDIMEERG